MKDVVNNNELRTDIQLLLAENDRLKKELGSFDLFYNQIDKIGFWSNGIKDNNVFWSDTVFKIFGFEPDEKHPMEIFDRHILEEDRESYWQFIRQSLESEDNNILKTNIRIFDKKGNLKYLNIQGSFEVNENGERTKVYGLIQDITEQKKIETELQQNKERFEMLFENMNEAFALHEIILDDNKKPVDYRFLEINPAFEKLTGLKKNKILGKRVLEVLPKTEYIWIERYGKVAISGEPVEFMNYSAELERYYQIKAYSPKQNYFAVIFDDVTDRVTSEKELQDSEQRFRSIIENAANAVFMSDMNGNIVNVNKKACNNLGYSEEELLAKKVMELDADYPTIEKCRALWDKIKPDESICIEGKHIRKDGSLIPVEIHISAIDIRGQKHIVGFANDISERKKYERELKKLSAVVQQSPLSIVITDLDGTIDYVNPQFTKITGYSYDEAIGQNPRILKTGNTTVEEYKKLYETLNKGNIWIGEFLNKRKDETTFWELATIAPIKDKEGNITNYIAIKEDISLRKQAQDALEKSQKELAEANAAKDKFFSIIAHDLKNPIGSILAFGDLINTSLINENYTALRKHVEVLNKSAQHTYNLLVNLLDWARSQTENIELHPRIINLERLIKDNINLLEFSANSKRIKIKNNVKKNMEVYADIQMIDTVIRNLISNAVKFTPENGRIEVNYKREKEKTIISISDTGMGIPENRIEYLFKIDKNISTEGTSKESGTGLGLILCKDFIERNNGEIWLESEENKGSVFYFSLPNNK